MNSLAIVALPTEDDYVNKISSEKVPHLTLLFLGPDVSKVKNLNKILDFTKHAADQTLTRFGLEVDRRGVLGPDEADVLFFAKTKWGGFPCVNEFRSNLLKDDNIHTAYDSTTQFPEWIPHLTLGYPATPAQVDQRDYPGINYVNFDRIAVWFADFEGVEFPLKSYNWDMNMDMAMSSLPDKSDIIKHHGVLGMKWGRRSASRFAKGSVSKPQKVTIVDKGKKIKTSGGEGHLGHPDAVRARTSGQIAKKSGLKALSNQELQAYTQRLNLEQQAKRLTFQDSSPGKKFVLTLLGKTGKDTAAAVTTGVATNQVKKKLLKLGLAAA